MNAVAVICPHCNARRAGASVGAKGKQLSPEEIRALLISEELVRSRDASPAGTFGALIRPTRPAASPVGALEVALSVIGLPLLVVGAAVIAFRMARRRGSKPPPGELGSVLTMILSGGAVLDGLMWLLGIHGSYTVIAISGLALIVRGIVRARSHPA
jgi:hypothetical protein